MKKNHILTSIILISTISILLPEHSSVRLKGIMNKITSQISLKAPFYVSDYFVPSGWIGDGEFARKYIQYEEIFRNKIPCPEDTDGTCIKIIYSPGVIQWGGIFWQSSPNNWGEKPGKYIKDATRISFWARGQKGGEKIEFLAGGIESPGKVYKDSFKATTSVLTLTNQWKKYTIDLKNKDLSSVLNAFGWMTRKDLNPDGLMFFIDEMRYE